MKWASEWTSEWSGIDRDVPITRPDPPRTFYTDPETAGGADDARFCFTLPGLLAAAVSEGYPVRMGRVWEEEKGGGGGVKRGMV